MEGPAPLPGAGRRPGDLMPGTRPEWYLRVDLHTAAGRGRIKVRAGDAGAELAAADVGTAILGPLRELPDTLTVRLDRAALDQQFGELVTGFAGAAADLADTAADLVLSVRGGHPGLAGAATRVWLSADLAGVGAEPVAFTDQAGEYRLTGSIRSAPGPGPAYEVRLDTLVPGDGVFVLAGLVDLAGWDPRRRVRAMLAASGRIDHGFDPVAVPGEYGALALPIAVYRHRDDTAASRAELLAAFRRSAEVETRSWCDRFAEASAELAGPSWRLGAVEVQAFTRAGPDGFVATVLSAEPDRWFSPGEVLSLPLDPEAVWRDPNAPSAERGSA